MCTHMYMIRHTYIYIYVYIERDIRLYTCIPTIIIHRTTGHRLSCKVIIPIVQHYALSSYVSLLLVYVYIYIYIYTGIHIYIYIHIHT